MEKPEDGKSVVLRAFDRKKEMEKVEKIARMIGKKWPKGLSSVELVGNERR